MNNSNFWAGIILAIASAASFGLIPLFAVPMMTSGMSPEKIALYRFGLAAGAMLPPLFIMKIKIRISLRQFFALAFLALFYFLDVQLFLLAFRYLASGLVATLEFAAPVFVLLIMIFFFHRKVSWQACAGTFLVLAGVWLLSGGMDQSPSNSGSDPFLGVIFSLLSAIFLSFYYIGCQQGYTGNLNPLLITFYLMLFGTFYSGATVCVSGTSFLPYSRLDVIYGLLLALVTAIFSNWTLIMAIKRIGPVLAAILGVAEPLTALATGVFVFKEIPTMWMSVGVLMVIIAAILATIGEKGPVQKD